MLGRLRQLGESAVRGGTRRHHRPAPAPIPSPAAPIPSRDERPELTSHENARFRALERYAFEDSGAEVAQCGGPMLAVVPLNRRHA